MALLEKLKSIFTKEENILEDAMQSEPSSTVRRPTVPLVEKKEALEKEITKLYLDFRNKKVSTIAIFEWVERFRSLIDHNDEISKSTKIAQNLSAFWIWIPVNDIKIHRSIARVLYQMQRHENPCVLAIAKSLVKITKDQEAKTFLENTIKIGTK